MIVPSDQLGTLAGDVTMVSGGFDPLHPGHLAYFRAAAELGPPLLVNVSHDEWVGRKHAPLLTQAERIQVIDALEMVAYVHAETGPTFEVLEALRPRYFAKGADWEGRLPDEERAVCDRHGVEVVFLDTVVDSSTDVLRRFRERDSQVEAPDGEALVDELARRLDDFDNQGPALVERLAEKLHAKVAVKLVDGLRPVRKLDYEGHDIWLVMSSSAILRRLGSVAKEPFTVAYIEEHVKPGDVFYDIGANVGPYSLIAAKATGGEAKVFAFEPSPASFRDLARNIELNECSESVTPLPLALWSETGLLPVAWRSDIAGAARHRLGSRPKARSLTIGIRLDDAIEQLGVPAPTHAKIDTDGHEVEVLRGAAKALADPGWRTLIVELDRKETDRNREIRELLSAAGFDRGVVQERTPSERYPDPGKRPDVYWVFTRAA